MHMGLSTSVHLIKACCKETSIRDVHLCSLVVSLSVVKGSEHTGLGIIKQFSMNCKVQLL
jgi:hypothetical protein